MKIFQFFLKKINKYLFSCLKFFILYIFFQKIKIINLQKNFRLKINKHIKKITRKESIPFYIESKMKFNESFFVIMFYNFSEISTYFRSNLKSDGDTEN